MLRNLPEGATFTAAMSAPAAGEATDTPEPDPELSALLDRKSWNEDRRLMAQLINAVNLLIRIQPAWQGSTPPDFPIVGPAEWREPAQDETSAPKATSVMDVLRLFS